MRYKSDDITETKTNKSILNNWIVLLILMGGWWLLLVVVFLNLIGKLN